MKSPAYTDRFGESRTRSGIRCVWCTAWWGVFQQVPGHRDRNRGGTAGWGSKLLF